MGITGAAVRTRVAIVDDCPEVRFLLATIVELDDRFEVVGEASDAAGVLATVADKDPDLILMDLDLGAEHGSSLIREIRRTGSTACVVVVTGSEAPSDHAAAFNAGADGIQSKCALTSTMVDELAAIVGRHSAAEAVASVVQLDQRRPKWFSGLVQGRGPARVPACV